MKAASYSVGLIYLHLMLVQWMCGALALRPHYLLMVWCFAIGLFRLQNLKYVDIQY